MEGVKVKKSRNGKGLFAVKDFDKQDTLLEIKGVLIFCYEEDDLDEKTRSNTIRFDGEMYLSPKGELGDFVNHSCEPNSKIFKNKGKLYLVAIKNIAKGEEITFDYSTIIASDDFWTMKCNCGSTTCRGTIGQFKKLPKKLRDKYLSLKMVPRYILNN